MEWEKVPPQQTEELNAGSSGGGGMFVKVMTDEQMEVLRKQIAIYATICEQLVELHKSITSHNDLSGMRLGNIYCDPLITSGCHKITGRQRWTPTAVQLQILERIFDQENGTPGKQKIKEITSDLSQHGQISETNVYNWFQNRRARSKRKQQTAPTNNAESEVETEAESSNEKKTKPEEFPGQRIFSSSAEDFGIQITQASSGSHYVDPRTSKPESTLPLESSKQGGGFGQRQFYDSMVSNSRMEQLTRKMEVPGNYNPYLQQDEYNMAE